MKLSTIVALASIVMLLAEVSAAQSTPSRLFESSNQKLNAELVPASSFIGVAAFPSQITSQRVLKLFPHEVVTAWGKKEIGFDPMLIKQATWVMRTPERKGENPVSAVVLHFENMQGLSGAMIDRLEKKKIAGKTVFSSNSQDELSFMLVDEVTMVIGSEAYFEEILSGTKGAVAKLFGSSTVQGQVYAFLDMKAIEPIVSEILLETQKFELAPPVVRMTMIPSLILSVEFGVETRETLESVLVMHCKSETAAAELNEILQEAIEYGKQNLLAQMTQQMNLEDPVQAATLAYTQRIAEKFQKNLSPVVNGKDVTVTAHEEVMTLPLLASLLGGATQLSVAGPSVKMTPANQLRQTSLAFHNYVSAHRAFVPRAIKDADGRPLLSGRVALLPFVEQSLLYDQLRMDEPWDSEHNSQFTSLVVPSFGVSPSGQSMLRFPVFPGSVWDGDDEKKFSDCRDGTSNTIFAIYAPPEAAVNWADPKPWTISKNNPMRDVFGDRDEITVAMLDGSVRKLKRSQMSNEKLKAMLTISGGEFFELE
ncbi:MAG: DUF1559 domain-containing protein [Mariniblastus sp.]|nr:DUF1559 domain-containing protein [Mariniblastus sp.]